MRVLAYQHGVYPRSERVVAATRDLERGRTTRQAVDDAFVQDGAAFVDVQRRAGLDLYSDGLLRWQDIFRPLVDASDGMRARSLVRWFDNNSFYRAPEIEAVAPIGSGAQGLVPGDLVPTPRVATLPSPYLFSRAAHVAGGRDRDALMTEVTDALLRPVAEAAVAGGAQVVHLQEPWLPYFGIDEGSWPAFESALGSLHAALGGRASLVLHLAFGDAAPHATRLRELPVDAVGIDFAQTDLDALGTGWQVGILAGCIDGRRSVVESPEEVAAFTVKAAAALQPPQVFVSSNCELELLGAQVAERKVLALGAAAAIVKEDLR
jgi:5-methyltetrahydropteroyltriglutamate--homocysteine methyltransferase